MKRCSAVWLTAMPAPASTYLTYSFIDIADYVIELNSGASFGGTVFNFNRDKWAEFSSDQREAILRATADASAHGAMTYSKEDAEALEAAKANGKHIVKVDAGVADALGCLDRGQ